MLLRTFAATAAIGLLASFTTLACNGGAPLEDEAFAKNACKGAAVDEDGYCRAKNGQFAKASCCASTAACDAATIDDEGVCRRADDGRFAPTACCDELCEGAEMDDGGFCRHADGRFALAACCADACASAAKQGDDPAELATCSGQSGVECELGAPMACLACAKDTCVTDVLDPEGDCAPYVACLNECGCDDEACRFGCDMPGACGFVIEDLHACMSDDCEDVCPTE